MCKRPTEPGSNHRRIGNAGFTLIELLVVIVILGILLGLLVPAVMRAVGTANDAACAAEIRAMGQAMAEFKSKYNCYPPSRILISENGDYSSATVDPTTPAGKLVARSLTYLRRIWPRLQFNTSSVAGNASGVDTSDDGIKGGKFYDVDGNGACATSPYVLYGHQCLTLFLGGVPQATGSTWSMTGFSKNPTNPFQTTVITSNRTVPMYEFNSGRLAGDSFPGYVDYFGATGNPSQIPYYAYFSAYEGVGYDPGDVDFAEADSSGNYSAVTGGVTTSNAATPNVATWGGKVVASPAPNPYSNDPPVLLDGTGAVVYAGRFPAWQSAQTFQIISSGRDRLYGIGGQYLTNGDSHVPFTAAMQSANQKVTSQNLQADARFCERDNISNFSAGRLD